MRGRQAKWSRAPHWRALGCAILIAVSCRALADPKEDLQADMQAQHWADADRRLQEVLARHPDNALARYWRAQVFERTGSLSAAREELEMALKLDPAERFASSTAVLSELKHRVMPKGPASAPTEQAAGSAAAGPSPQSSDPNNEIGVASMAFALRALLYLGGLAVVGMACTCIYDAWSERRRAKVQRSRARQYWSTALKDAKAALEDAVKVSDANPMLSPEAQLANFDRARDMKVRIDQELAQGARVDDFVHARGVVAKAADLAAELESRERPSDKAVRLQREEDARSVQARESVSWPLRSTSAVHLIAAAPSAGSPGDLALGLALGSALASTSARATPSANAEAPARLDVGGDGILGSSSSVDVGGTSAGGADSFGC
jgi:tetratricopeptide (TPR) repeat protein